MSTIITHEVYECDSTTCSNDEMLRIRQTSRLPEPQKNVQIIMRHNTQKTSKYTHSI